MERTTVPKGELMKKGGHVQILRKRMGAAIMALCLLVALACGGTIAVAAGGFPDEGTNTLTVTASSSTDEAFVEDITSASVVVDVYKIADAAPDASYVKYNYTLVAPFDSLEITDFSAMNAEGWQKLAVSAAKLVTSDMEPMTVAADGETALDLPSDGLYLMVPHGGDVTLEYGDGIVDSMIAQSELYEYSFMPSITAAPTKGAAEDGSIGTAVDYGEWTRDIQVALKPEFSPRYGDVRITKYVESYNGDATFVFHLVGTTPDGKTYENYAGINYSGGANCETVVTHIPAGTVLTITEEYPGAGYVGDSSARSATIVAGEVVDIEGGSFVNAPDITTTEGHGIVNHFELDEGGNWPLEADPAQSGSAEQE